MESPFVARVCREEEDRRDQRRREFHKSEREIERRKREKVDRLPEFSMPLSL